MQFVTMVLLAVICACTLAAAQSKGGRWEFENGGADSAPWDGQEDAGVLQAGAAFDDDPPLQQGMYYLFLDSTAVHDYLLVEDSDDLDFDDEDLAISAWIYPIQIDEVQFIVNKGVQNTVPKTTNYAIRISNSLNLEFLIRDIDDQAQTVASSFTIPEDQWTFIAVFYRFAEQTVFMWNEPFSDPVDTLDFAHAFFSNEDPLSIGAWYVDDPAAPSIRDFEGRIDDVRISGRLEDVLPGPMSIGGEAEPPRTAWLNANYPNPFNPATHVEFGIGLPAGQAGQAGSADWVTLKIYDLSGRLVRTLVDGPYAPGVHRVVWNGRDRNGIAVSSGSYFYRLQSGEYTATRPMQLIR